MRPVPVEDAVSGAGASVAGASGAGSGRGAGVLRSVVPLVGVLLLAVAMVVLFIRAYEPLSPLDEMEHIDYVHHLLDGDMVELGDTFDPATERAVACRGVDLPYTPPPCGGPYVTADFPNAGYNTAYIHAPLYYGVTAGWVWLGERLALPGDDVSLMRSSGILWAAATVVLMWALLGSLRLSRGQRLAGCLLVLASPTVVLALSTVTNDSTAVAVGAAVTLAVVRWDQGRAPLWVVVLVCAVGVLLKATNIGVVGLAVAYVALRAWQRHRAAAPGEGPGIGRVLWPVAAVVAGVGVTTVAWTLYSAGVARISPSDLPRDPQLTAPGFDVSLLFQGVASVLRSQETWFPGPLPTAVSSFAKVTLVVLFVLAVAARDRRDDIGALAGATAVAVLGLGPVLAVVDWLGSDVSFDISMRYALSLVPAVAAVAVTAARSRLQAWALAAVAGLCCLLAFLALLLP
jgi:hypothetical protein